MEEGKTSMVTFVFTRIHLINFKGSPILGDLCFVFQEKKSNLHILDVS